MTIPGFQDLMLPGLEEIARRGETRTSELVELMADRFRLTEGERAILLPSGRQTVIANRVHWAIAYLGKALLLERTRRAHYQATERGKTVLKEQPPRIDLKFLERFPEVAAFRGDRNSDSPNLPAAVEATPDEVVRTAHREIEAALRADIVQRILQCDARFFEALVLRLLLAMGYGGGDPSTAQVVGGAGDEGVDVVVHQDPLGLDRVYVQAKRYARDRTVGPGTVHALAGSLGIFKASKGLLVTTAGFTRAAREAAERVASRVVLVDGDELAGLMIRYGVGVRVAERFEIKKVDEDFFLE